MRNGRDINKITHLERTCPFLMFSVCSHLALSPIHIATVPEEVETLLPRTTYGVYSVLLTETLTLLLTLISIS